MDGDDFLGSACQVPYKRLVILKTAQIQEPQARYGPGLGFVQQLYKRTPGQSPCRTTGTATFGPSIKNFILHIGHPGGRCNIVQLKVVA